MEILPKQPPALFHTHQHHPPDRSQAQAHPSMQKESSSSAKVTKSLNMLNEYICPADTGGIVSTKQQPV